MLWRERELGFKQVYVPVKTVSISIALYWSHYASSPVVVTTLHQHPPHNDKYAGGGRSGGRDSVGRTKI